MIKKNIHPLSKKARGRLTHSRSGTGASFVASPEIALSVVRHLGLRFCLTQREPGE
jgi:hypothetical protein